MVHAFSPANAPKIPGVYAVKNMGITIAGKLLYRILFC
jgi:hypothetical protein